MAIDLESLFCVGEPGVERDGAADLWPCQLLLGSDGVGGIAPRVYSERSLRLGRLTLEGSALSSFLRDLNCRMAGDGRQRGHVSEGRKTQVAGKKYTHLLFEREEPSWSCESEFPNLILDENRNPITGTADDSKALL